jgi:predicted phage terminase large subunit-like protein
MTRWHTADLAGYLLDDNTDNWHYLRLPAYAEDNDPLDRTPGQTLEGIFTPEEFARRKAQMGSYGFAALYQQDPMQSQGRLFDTVMIETKDTDPPASAMVRFWDLAITAKARASYTVGLKMGYVNDGRYHIYHIWRDQREYPDVKRAIKQMASVDGKGTHIVIEAEKAGQAALQELLRDRDLAGYSIQIRVPKGDKYSRAGPVAERVNAGLISISAGPHVRAFLDELSVYSGGAAVNDQVDALSGAYTELDAGKWPSKWFFR